MLYVDSLITLANPQVTDYGLTREGTYYAGGIEGMPVRWMSPEALEERRWSEKSDVYAFGVVLWEATVNKYVSFNEYLSISTCHLTTIHQ